MRSRQPGRPMCVGAIVLRAGGPDPTACSRVRALIARGVDVVDCDAGGLDAPDARTIDALLQLTLTARRCGGRLRLLGAPTRLVDVLAACGLGDVLEVAARPEPEADGPVVRPGGQPKNTSASA